MSSAATGLEELHQLHIRKAELEKKLAAGPLRVEKQQKQIEKQKQAIEELQEQQKQLRMTADEKSLQLKSNEAKIVDLKLKLNLVTTNKEFAIIKSQIDADTMANSVLEDEILEVYEKVDHVQGKITDCENAHSQAVEMEQKISKEIEAERPGLESGISMLNEELKEAEKIIPSSLSEEYKRLVLAHGAGALVAVSENSCSSCHAILSPNEKVQLNMGELLFCRSCYRIMYRAKKSS